MKYDFNPPERELSARDWKRMYTILLGAIDDAMSILPEQDDTRVVRHILKNAAERAEEYYITASGGNREI